MQRLIDAGMGDVPLTPAPVPLLELPQQPDRLRVHRAVGDRRAALALCGEVIEGRLSVSIRQDALVCRIKDCTQFGGIRQSVR